MSNMQYNNSTLINISMWQNPWMSQCNINLDECHNVTKPLIVTLRHSTLMNIAMWQNFSLSRLDVNLDECRNLTKTSLSITLRHILSWLLQCDKTLKCRNSTSTLINILLWWRNSCVSDYEPIPQTLWNLLFKPLPSPSFNWKK